MNATAMKALAAKGYTLEQIIEIAEALEAGEATAEQGQSSAAKRQARYRERNKASRVTSRDVTDVTPPPPPAPPPPTQGVEGRDDDDSGSIPPPIVPPQQREHRLPAGWEPDASLLAWAAESFPTVDVTLETEKFIDHWSAKNERRLDWRASWRNWIRKAVRDYTSEPRRFPSRMDGIVRTNRERINAALARYEQEPAGPPAGGPRLKLVDASRGSSSG